MDKFPGDLTSWMGNDDVLVSVAFRSQSVDSCRPFRLTVIGPEARIRQFHDNIEKDFRALSELNIKALFYGYDGARDVPIKAVVFDSDSKYVVQYCGGDAPSHLSFFGSNDKLRKAAAHELAEWALEMNRRRAKLIASLQKRIADLERQQSGK